jgi:hypothetical protein
MVCGAICVAGARASLFAVPLARRRVIRAFRCATVVAAAMAAMALATLIYTFALMIDAAHLAQAPNGPFEVLSTGVSLFVQLLVMVLAAALATTATTRGWRAQGAERDARAR